MHRRTSDDGPQPTMSDVAKLAGVSRALVSLVFRNPDKVSKERKERVLTAAKIIGYEPNYYAQKLASLDTRSIGVLVSDIMNPFFMDVVSGIQDAAESATYDILYGLSNNNPAQDLRTLRQFQQYRVSGVVVVATAMKTSVLTQALRDTPAVISGQDVSSSGLTSILNDELEGARLSLNHIYSLGHRKAVYIGSGHDHKRSVRAEAYRQISENYPQLDLDFMQGGFDERSGVRAAQAILSMSSEPTAVIAANDLSAVGALAVFRQQGVKVPQEISILGYDNSYVSALKLANLSTIAQSGDLRGATADNALVEELSGETESGRAINLTPKLIVRDTTGPCHLSS